MSFWAYMLHCRGGNFYVGHTDDLERRMAQHDRGEAPGFVADHWPAKLVWSQQFASREEALATERRIKGWSRAKKLALIREDWDEISRLAKSKFSPSTSSGRTVASFESDSPVRAEPVEALHLIFHSEAPARSIQSVGAAIECGSSRWSLRFEVIGKRLLVPFHTEPLRTDGLWQTTCFELFVADGDGYREFNFSPSGAWAAYRFTGYREGMAPLDMPAPVIALERSEERLTLTVTLDPAAMPPMSRKIGLSAVIEEQDGTRSYWALAHPPGKPDFHDPACFALELPAPDNR